MADDVRHLIRELVRTELAAYRQSTSSTQPVHSGGESVSIASDRDLTRFAQRILKLSRDPQTFADIEAGRYQFTLNNAPPAAAEKETTTIRFDKGLISEREIRNIPPGVSKIVIGKLARLTPLAKDELNKLKITVERATQ